jgi:Cu(I)/Ag(I) efflux system membrane protein CusA/SilA
MKLIEDSSKLVGPGVLHSTLIVIALFYPFFFDEEWKENYLVLAWTKSFILIVDAF